MLSLFSYPVFIFLIILLCSGNSGALRKFIPIDTKRGRGNILSFCILFSHTLVGFSESVLIIQTDKQIGAKFKEPLSSGTITGIEQKIQDVFVGIRCWIILPQLASMTRPELKRLTDTRHWDVDVWKLFGAAAEFSEENRSRTRKSSPCKCKMWAPV